MEYLIDTNVLIYLSQGDSSVADFLENLDQDQFFISTVTRLEFLHGAEKVKATDIENYLDGCINLPFTAQIADLAAKIHSQRPSTKFKDAIIASTAMHHKKTLVTYDKAFKKVRALKVQLLKH
jgi:predicted nucleic acid-binding protein